MPSKYNSPEFAVDDKVCFINSKQEIVSTKIAYVESFPDGSVTYHVAGFMGDFNRNELFENLLAAQAYLALRESGGKE